MINQAQILGRVGKIETNMMSTGTKVTNIAMVTSKKFVKNGQKEEKSTWHNITCFAKVAEIAEKYVQVGDLLYIQGEMENKKYTAKDGQEKIKFFIIANELKLMPKTQAKEKEAAPKPQPTSDSFVEDDDVPW